MAFFENLKLVPGYYFLSFGVIILLLLGILFLSKYREKNFRNSQNQQSRPKIIKFLNLFGFGVFSFALIAFAIMVVSSYQGTSSETKTAPSQVDIPADLPFEVEEIAFTSPDGLKIVGWLVPPQNQATIILLHGYGGNRLAMRWHAEKLVEAGYGVLMIDERGSGESEGEYRSYGWEDPADVGGAIRFLQNRLAGPITKIGIAGCSIGGQIALQSGAYFPEIGAVWADGPSTVRAADIQPPDNFLTWLIVVSNYVLDWMYQWRLGIEAPKPMIEIIDEIAPSPIMLVGGGIELPITGSEAPQMRQYASYAGENAEVWIIEEAFHCDGPQRRPEEYAARLVKFFDQAFEGK